MIPTLENKNITAALKRAAYKAVHGTREERAGRFLPAKRRRALPTRAERKQRMLSQHKV